MKKLLCAVVFMLAAVSAHADEQGDTSSLINLLRTDIKTSKQELVTAAMHFNEKESAVFWPIYRKYEFDLSKIGDQQVDLIKDFAANYDTLQAAKAKELVSKQFKIQQQILTTQQKYYKDFEKAVGPIKAGRFLQVDNQIMRLIQLQVASELPLMQ